MQNIKYALIYLSIIVISVSAKINYNTAVKDLRILKGLWHCAQCRCSELPDEGPNSRIPFFA